ncbi:uncharacterized protein BX663DRAFT_504230 [Cokeromyces recurvatus]|uniref:uncharacterized protein n=1 Tax=Cokeromyces recurvatus TaxID=90255 RepID=UPI00222029C6|nr:uncharacterized protein BX663DRAFT_504230 [Cokeromyces recurvatus]KAI7904188.1 hypothetical protein BX663DRAFT_504230 [Cokeromyces recurvatus]
MNSAHNTKNWHHQQTLHNSSSPVSQSSQIQHYPPMMEHHYNSNFHQGPLHSPVHQLPPTTHFLPSGKPESDPRLPGMMAISQPGTPRPNMNQQERPISPPPPQQKKLNTSTSFTSTSFPSNPYPHQLLGRKRGRSELFSNELGPFFSSTKPIDNLYALDRSTLLTVRIQAKMDRGFFLADNDWTCYRRNYFQVSSAFSIHGLNTTYYTPEHDYPCLVQVDNSFYPVRQFSMCISTRISNSDKSIELVQHTPKRDKGPQTTPLPKPVMPGGNLSMTAMGGTTSQSIVTFERIQFKTATANNGKRRAAQQYYVCLVDLFADIVTIDGSFKSIKVATCQSAPLVVRGRSPGHYSDNQQERYEHSIALAAVAAATNLSSPEERYFPRPPMTPPAAMPPQAAAAAAAAAASADYSPYPYPTYPYGFHHGIIGPPPTPGGGSALSSNFMVPSMTNAASSSSETSSPDIYHSSESNPKLSYASLDQQHVWQRGRMGQQQPLSSPMPYNQHSAPSTPYEERKYNM